MIAPNRGMTLVETLITLAIFITVIAAVGTFEANVFIYKGNVSTAFTTTQSAQVILKTILTELREMAPALDGSYPLISAGSTTMSFFSDLDNDGTEEEVTYLLSSTTLYRLTIQPTGNPPVYSLSNQSTTTLLTSVRNGSVTPVFQYFDTNYNGTSSPLTQPVTTTAVRLVKVNLTLDIDQNRSPLPATFTVQASLRNLKSNL